MSYVEGYFDWLGEKCLAQYQQEEEQVDNNTKNGALKDAALDVSESERSSTPDWITSFLQSVGGV